MPQIIKDRGFYFILRDDGSRRGPYLLRRSAESTIRAEEMFKPGWEEEADEINRKQEEFINRFSRDKDK